MTENINNNFPKSGFNSSSPSHKLSVISIANPPDILVKSGQDIKFKYLRPKVKYEPYSVPKNTIVLKILPNGCYQVSNKKKDRDGYTIIRKNHKDIKLHRLIYERVYGEIPPGMVIRHSCDNPPCINPAHLLCGTQTDNIKDREERKKNNNGNVGFEQTSR